MEKATAGLRAAWTPAACGIKVARVPMTDVVQVTSDRVYLDDVVADALAGRSGAVLTTSYLVNTLGKPDGPTVPYSFMTAIDAAKDDGATVPRDLADDQIVINEWLAEHGQAKPGDTLRVTWFRVSADGDLVPRSRAFRVRAVVPMGVSLREGNALPEVSRP